MKIPLLTLSALLLVGCYPDVVAVRRFQDGIQQVRVEMTEQDWHYPDTQDAENEALAKARNLCGDEQVHVIRRSYAGSQDAGSWQEVVDFRCEPPEGWIIK